MSLPLWLLAGVALTFLYLWRSVRKPTRPLPPGPKPLPIVGNAFDMPTDSLGPGFRDLNMKYNSDLVYLEVFGQPTISIGSYEAAYELLERRSAITADRQPAIMAQLTGFMWDMGIIPYTTGWRAHRRMFHQFFNNNTIHEYQPTQARETHRLLRRLLDDPNTLIPSIRLYFGATIMGIVYGVDITQSDDKYLKLVQVGLDVFNEIMVPGRYTVENLPFLRYLPSWFPGASFKRAAEKWRSHIIALRDVPYDEVVDGVAKGTARQCIAAQLVDQVAQAEETGKNKVEEEDTARDVAAVAYLTGADTTFAGVVAFFLAMVIYPDVQKKAQAEVDAVVGPGRLPEFADRKSMPYINALIKEITRWHVVVTLSIPHRTVEDDEYNGYHIPKGTVLIPNPWAYSRDPKHYANPEEFRPERFLNEKGEYDPNASLDPETYVFGNGRRICPGRHFAHASMFMIVSSVLACYNITAPTGPDGKPVKVEPNVTTDTLLSYPKPFDCVIKPRSEQAEALVRAPSSFEDI